MQGYKRPLSFSSISVLRQQTATPLSCPQLRGRPVRYHMHHGIDWRQRFCVASINTQQSTSAETTSAPKFMPFVPQACQACLHQCMPVPGQSVSCKVSPTGPNQRLPCSG